MPKKYKVVQVTVRRATGVDNYLKYAGNPGKWMKEVVTGVSDFKNWTVDVDGERVTGAHPTVTGHPGHIDPPTKGWKINVERGNSTVDRVFVKVKEVKQEPSKSDPNMINVKIMAAITVEEDTKKRKPQK